MPHYIHGLLSAYQSTVALRSFRQNRLTVRTTLEKAFLASRAFQNYKLIKFGLAARNLCATWFRPSVLRDVAILHCDNINIFKDRLKTVLLLKCWMMALLKLNLDYYYYYYYYYYNYYYNNQTHTRNRCVESAKSSRSWSTHDSWCSMMEKCREFGRCCLSRVQPLPSMTSARARISNSGSVERTANDVMWGLPITLRPCNRYEHKYVIQKIIKTDIESGHS